MNAAYAKRQREKEQRQQRDIRQDRDIGTFRHYGTSRFPRVLKLLPHSQKG